MTAELDHNNIISLTAEGDRTTQLRIGVWQGNASISVWANSKQIFRTAAPRALLEDMADQLQKIVLGAPGSKENFTFSRWDNETKKLVALGSLTVGRDDKALIYLGIQAPNNPPVKFLFKSPISFEHGTTPMTDVERSELAARTAIAQLKLDIPIASILTNYKRQHTGGGGGNRGGGAESSGSIF